MSSVVPALTAVIICYNDAQRLPAAINSLRRQSRQDIEIVVVDHGSDDGSAAVAEQAAAEDPRMTVVALGDHRGKPGVPINAGIAAATAPWVVVMGSDDVMRRRGCETLLRVAEESGADIVVGGVRRVDMDTREATRWMPSVTLRSRTVTDVAQFPDLIRDTIGGFKLYRKQFLLDNGLRFPEDIYYQDQVLTIGCYAAAHTVAIASRFVGDWRHWYSSQRKSVTQRKTTIENLADRFEANRRIDRFLVEHGREDLLLMKQRKFLTHDLSVHVKDIAAAEPGYRSALVDMTRRYTAAMPEAVFDGIPLDKWLMVACLRAGRVDDAEMAAASHYVQMLTEWGRIHDRGATYLVPPWLPAQPDPVFDVTRFRFEAIPDRLRPARGWVTVHPLRRRRLRCDVVIVSAGRSDMADPTAGRLVLRDPVDGRSHSVPLGAAASVAGDTYRWQVDLRGKALDSAVGAGAESLELHAVFHDAAPQKWSLRLRAHEQQPPFPAEREDWHPNVADTAIVLERPPRRTAADRVRERSARARTPPPPPPDPVEELTPDQALDYFSDHPGRRRADGVFFESFQARRIGGGPLAMSVHLADVRPLLPQRWGCTAFSVPEVPGYAAAAPRLTRRYVDQLAESAVWVVDGPLPFDPGDRAMVQLWHGVPLSPIAAPEQAPRWTHVVTSGDYMTERLSEAFGDGAELVACGAPRTDPLLAPDAAGRRRLLRTAWGIDDRTVVLHLPALRPGRVAQTYRRPDLHELGRTLAAGFFWLYREHDDDTTGKQMVSVPDDLRWFAGPLSARTDMSDYLLMADILISDYSSVMVDFGWTGRPVIHYAPDADFFESEDPGTCISLADTAAGPVVATDADLLEALKSLAGAVGDGASRRFSETLAPLDAQPSSDPLRRRLGL